MRNLVLMTCGLALTLTGCAGVNNNRPSMKVEIEQAKYSVPVTKVQANKLRAVVEELVERYSHEMSDQAVVIEWSTIASKKLAQQAARHFKIAGFDSKLVNKPQSTLGSSIAIKFSGYQTKVDVCEYLTSDHFMSDVTGCFIEANRWSSMVNPQKMLIQPSIESVEVSK
ncbi:hypothetical protein M445_05545 [Vibrio owensii 47666-1]|uniref:hypothetical protein n=1 Tax=Vibrio owensii TaxID=696485 RepID=UPI0005847103|nr:hypothetical protein [Vibrio owensii]KIF48804.1 hypothetical protein M445_05545 [Vibrio owensii 47666-1]